MTLHANDRSAAAQQALRLIAIPLVYSGSKAAPTH